ncbi:MAG: conjugal transfer protein TraH [Legionellales bacterium]|jgi:conjugative transfer pilus assembly protein TraH
MKRFILSLSLCASISAQADISSDMTNFFNNMGFQTNTTGAGAYQGQTAGLYTGGQLFARQEVRKNNLGSISFPSYRGGCGGIDMFMGGFSFINADELVSLFEAIGNNALGFTWLLAMDTLSPSINNATQTMQNLANEVNAFNINSCEAAASVVGGVWPKTDEAQKQVCANIAASTGKYSDWAAARQACGAEGERAEILQDHLDGEFKELILHDTNLAWQAIQKNDFLRQDSQLAELFMSLTGTIIIDVPQNDHTEPRYQYFYPLIERSSVISSLLYGGDATLYQCRDLDECLEVNESAVTIAVSSGFVQQVQEILDGITQKIIIDQELSDSEIAFLGSTSLPIYKMLNVEAAYSTAGSLLNLHSYAEMIALDILYQYLNETLEVMLASSQYLHMSDELVQPYKDGIREAKQSLYQLQSSSQSHVMESIDLIQRTKALEQELAGKLSSHLILVLGWGHGVR